MKLKNNAQTRFAHNHRRSHKRWLLPTWLALLIALATCNPINAAEAIKPDQIRSLLKNGGYVIYLRHASTEKDYADQVSATMGNCATQRTLSEKGWQEAELIGSTFKLLGIPVGALYSSEYCRAWQTARLAFGIPIKLAALNFEPAEEYTAEQTGAMRDRVAPLLAEKPATGTNTVIVGHDDPFEAATGIYPEPQGVAYVVRPNTKKGFDVIGYIKPDQWPTALNHM